MKTVNRFIFKHIIHLLRYFEILSLSKIENDVCKGIFKLVKSMLKIVRPIFCRKKSSLVCTLEWSGTSQPGGQTLWHFWLI